MKAEYDFTGGKRGMFFRENAQFNLPEVTGRPDDKEEIRAVWTNSSVRTLAGLADPVKAVISRARSIVAQAIDAGWKGPPYEPLDLAQLLGIQVQPEADVRDARTVSADRSNVVIQYNPNQPRRRIRYSVAHEIGHTFFPDFHLETRHRHLPGELSSDAWQLEALCNLAAAELLMPYGTMAPLSAESLTIDQLIALREVYLVSTEAMLIRATHIAQFPCAMICAHRTESGDYKLDYSVQSTTFGESPGRSVSFSKDSPIAECVAIGYTAKGDLTVGERVFHVECVGIPPYPGSQYPRVAGILKPKDAIAIPQGTISYLKGSALSPRGDGNRIIAHVVNNKTANWGGGGFASRLRNTWPIAQQEFRDWSLQRKLSESLGDICVTRVSDSVWVASMVAQVGFGPSPTPRIRYAALRVCLQRVAEVAISLSGTLHIPRIGCGLAGGKWEIIEEIVSDAISERAIAVTVYDLPENTQ